MFQVVWLKRDLRLFDHEPLVRACLAGQVLLLYVFEPLITQHPEMSKRHEQFIRESLIDIEERLPAIGGQIRYAVGDILEVLEDLSRRFGAFSLWSHQETGSPHTYQRDRDVKAWMNLRGLSWIESPTSGIARGKTPLPLTQWRLQWEQFMNLPLRPSPAQIKPPQWIMEFVEKNESAKSSHVAWYARVSDVPFQTIHGSMIQKGQLGGEKLAWAFMQSFTDHRYRTYAYNLSKPQESQRSCSRLSPYLAYGNLSLRTVLQTAQEYQDESIAREQHSWKIFGERLRWRDANVQKFESQPELAIISADARLDASRVHHEAQYQRWLTGKTGYPLVDACMRQLHHTGWLHFRGRCLVVSFVTQTLWMDWRRPATDLAQLFLDFEPGIHYPQIQMQASTIQAIRGTEIQHMRIYNPLKQALEHDPNGAFVKTWIPELRHLSAPAIFEPWNHPDGLTHGYPAPMVEAEAANQRARKQVYESFIDPTTTATTRTLPPLELPKKRKGSHERTDKKRVAEAQDEDQLSFTFGDDV